ncbi:MAG: hypothetical protein ACRDAX_01120 [Propionibacteriaceae bacterium]
MVFKGRKTWGFTKIRQWRKIDLLSAGAVERILSTEIIFLLSNTSNIQNFEIVENLKKSKMAAKIFKGLRKILLKYEGVEIFQKFQR